MIKLLETASYSFPKTKDRINQDSILAPKPFCSGFLLAIADGVGSYKDAEQASNKAITIISEITDKSLVTNKIHDLFLKIRNEIISLSQGRDSSHSMATTLTICYLDEGHLYIGHVGDCRVYFKNQKNKLIQITKDHTYFQELIDQKIYRKHLLKKKGKNILTTAIAQGIEMKADLIKIPLLDISHDGRLTIFLMSDGSYRYWENRPRFSLATLKNVNKFASSLKKRIETPTPSDDYSLVAATFSVSD